MVRVGPLHREVGDPYVWSVTAVRDGDTVTLKGAWWTREAVPGWMEECRAVRVALEAAGFGGAVWERADGRRVERGARA